MDNTTKFNVSVVDENGKFTKVGVIQPSKSGRAWSLGLKADMVHLLKASPDGSYVNAVVTVNDWDEKHKSQSTYTQVKESAVRGDVIPF